METPEKPLITISCFKCGEALVCGAVNGNETCWCAALPHRMPLDKKATSCYCLECLEKTLQTGLPAT